MRLNINCVRQVLLTVEELQQIGKDGVLTPLGVRDLVNQLEKNDFEQKDIFYTVKQLLDSKLVEGHVHITGHQHNYVIQDLSPKGHAFLENIRAPERWEEIMTICKQAQSYSLPLVEELASTLAFNHARQQVDPEKNQDLNLAPAPSLGTEPQETESSSPHPPPEAYFPSLDPTPHLEQEGIDEDWIPPPLPYVDEWPETNPSTDPIDAWAPPHIQELENTIHQLEEIYLNKEIGVDEKNPPPLIDFIADPVDDEEESSDPLEAGFSL